MPMDSEELYQSYVKEAYEQYRYFGTQRSLVTLGTTVALAVLVAALPRDVLATFWTVVFIIAVMVLIFLIQLWFQGEQTVASEIARLAQNGAMTIANGRPETYSALHRHVVAKPEKFHERVGFAGWFANVWWDFKRRLNWPDIPSVGLAILFALALLFGWYVMATSAPAMGGSAMSAAAGGGATGAGATAAVACPATACPTPQKDVTAAPLPAKETQAKETPPPAVKEATAKETPPPKPALPPATATYVVKPDVTPPAPPAPPVVAADKTQVVTLPASLEPQNEPKAAAPTQPAAPAQPVAAPMQQAAAPKADKEPVKHVNVTVPRPRPLVCVIEYASGAKLHRRVSVRPAAASYCYRIRA